MSYFKKNLDVKFLCNEWESSIGVSEGSIVSYIIWCTAFSNKIPFIKYTDKLIDDYYNKKNQNFRKWVEKSRDKGELLPKLSDNFKLIYHFPMDSNHSLIYSKFNKTYYYIQVAYVWDKKKQKRSNFEEWHVIRKKYKKKMSKNEFFKKIIQYYKKLFNKEELKQLGFSRFFKSSDGKFSYYDLFLNKKLN